MRHLFSECACLRSLGVSPLALLVSKNGILAWEIGAKIKELVTQNLGSEAMPQTPCLIEYTAKGHCKETSVDILSFIRISKGQSLEK